MRQSRAAPVQGAWQLDVEDFHSHRLSLRRVTPSGLYWVYLNGRSLGCWRGQDTAMPAAEWALSCTDPRQYDARIKETGNRNASHPRIEFDRMMFR